MQTSQNLSRDLDLHPPGCPSNPFTTSSKAFHLHWKREGGRICLPLLVIGMTASFGECISLVGKLDDTVFTRLYLHGFVLPCPIQGLASKRPLWHFDNLLRATSTSSPLININRSMMAIFKITACTLKGPRYARSRLNWCSTLSETISPSSMAGSLALLSYCCFCWSCVRLMHGPLGQSSKFFQLPP